MKFSPTDPRTADLPFMGSPWTVVSLCALYLYFVLGKGQQWMKNRSPYELKAVISAYNIFQILINLYLSVMVSGFIASLNSAVEIEHTYSILR
jgi:GNS1/SUR4 family